MREIKFRMFDTEEKRFMNGSRVIESKIYDLNKPGRFLYQQYTGLEDKNGVKIYEDDVFDCNGRNGQVIMDTRTGQWSIKQINESITSIEPIWHWNEDAAVIGNIYENPDLMKEEQPKKTFKGIDIGYSGLPFDDGLPF